MPAIDAVTQLRSRVELKVVLRLMCFERNNLIRELVDIFT